MKLSRQCRWWLLGLATALLLSGCSMRRCALLWVSGSMIEGAMSALMAETDIELARTGLESELKLLEGFIQLDPDNRELLLIAAQGFTGYAMMFLEDDEPQRAAQLYERARGYGIRVLATRERRFLETDLTYDEFTSLLRRLGKGDLPAVYWTAAAWAGRINLERNSARSIAESARATELMRWVLEREPHYYYSGPLWFFGTYYATLPPLAGGDPVKAEEYFKRAIQADGDAFLWGRLLCARTYAVQTLDRQLFEAVLTDVMAGAPDEPEDLRLLNRVAVRKAELLLARADELF